MKIPLPWMMSALIALAQTLACGAESEKAASAGGAAAGPPDAAGPASSMPPGSDAAVAMADGASPIGASDSSAPPPPPPPIAAPIPQNSLDTVDPNFVIPNMAALVPAGELDATSIPSTLDLAEMATQYLIGMTRTLLPENPYFHVPPGMVNMHGTPTAIFAGGAPNWGKTVQAMIMARKMSGYDLDDAHGTMTPQLMSTRNMIDPNVNRNLISRGEGAWHVITGANPENQMTTTVEALMELQKQFPSGDLGQLIAQMIAYHQKMAIPDQNDDGAATLHYRLPTPGVGMYGPSSTGAIGYGDWPFHVGKTMRALGTWSITMSDPQVLAPIDLLGTFMRGYSNGLFWSVPAGFPEGAGEGHFAGHVHMYANGLMGMLWEAEARLRNDPNDAKAPQLIDFVKKSYSFIREMHDGAASALGNFGEVCTLGDMLRLAVKLTELGAGDFNEDIDRWIRNQAAESQIRGAITIESHPEDPLRDRIGEKVIGLFYEDATHPLAIPDTHNDQGDLTLQLVACGLGNPVHGIFDVWQHIVQVKQDVAQVNLPLNRATPYLDVESEVPYRGAVHVVTRPSLGPITSFEMRIPDGVNGAQVNVVANGALVPFQWVRTNFVKVTSLQPSTRYVVTFALPYRQMTFKQIRNQSQNWAESNYAVSSGTTQDYAFHHGSPENTYVGTFRGNTLVQVDHRPSGGIALYQGQDRAYWATLGAADAPSTPTHVAQRFRLKAN